MFTHDQMRRRDEIQSCIIGNNRPLATYLVEQMSDGEAEAFDQAFREGERMAAVGACLIRLGQAMGRQRPSTKGKKGKN